MTHLIMDIPKKTEMIDIPRIVKQFKIEGKFGSASPIGSGHINDSWLIATTPAVAPDYVLQRINHTIFRNVPELTNNILRVTRHLKQRLLCRDEALNWFRVIQLIETRSGNYFFHDPDGNYWRLYDHVNDTTSYDLVGSPAMACEAGKAYGLFQHLSSDIEASSLFEILPDFHHIAVRLQTFRDAVLHDPAGRVAATRSEIAFAESRAEEMHTILQLGETGKIPLRVTHNDTKFNNVLFNRDQQAIAVVDLDTVMPGYLLYDFGDAIRTGANTGEEDESDLSKVNIDLVLFEAYARGYLGVVGRSLWPAETAHLAFSAKYMTYLIGLRFLTDHLNGDHYFKTRFPGHNLQRARAQFKLLESMEEHFGEMKEIILALDANHPKLP